MDPKDYRAIAKIMRLSELVTGTKTDLRKDLRAREHISKKLADYFEGEFKDNLENTEERFKAHKKKNDKFNRKKFLKDCGVK